MRTAKIVFISLALLTVAGCPNEQLHSSIEHMNKGIEAYKTGAIGVAVESFQEATRVYPDNHAAWYYLGQGFRESSNWEDAAEAFGRAVKLKADDAMYQMFLGIALAESNKSALALSHLEKAVQLEPNLYRAHWYLGSIYNESERPEDAAQAWSRAATLNPDWGRPFVSLGKLYLTWDMVSEAISVLEQGTLHVDSEHLPDVYYYLGLSYDAQKNWDKAIEAYSKAIDAARESKKDNVEAKFQRGLAYIQKGDKGRAKTDLEEVASSSPDPFTKQEANKVLMTLIAVE